MRGAFKIAGFIVAGIVGIKILIDAGDVLPHYGNGYHTSHTGYYAFAIWAHNGFWGKAFLFGLLLTAAFFINLYLTRIVEKNDPKAASEADDILVSSAMIGFGAIFVVAAIAAYEMGRHHEPNWYEPDVFVSLISVLANLPYMLLYIIVPPFIVYAVVMMAYTWWHAFIVLTTNHPATNLVETTAKRKRPHQQVEAELARIIQERSITDYELKERIRELPVTSRWTATVKYRKLAADAERLRALANAQRKTVESETDLMWDVHDLERARRKTNDRRG